PGRGRPRRHPRRRTRPAPHGRRPSRRRRPGRPARARRPRRDPPRLPPRHAADPPGMESRPSDPLRRPSSRPAISRHGPQSPSADAVHPQRRPPSAPCPLSAFPLVPAGRIPMNHSVTLSTTGATPVYGVSTGFGALADTAIPTHMRQALQRSLIRSHAAGTGPEVETEVVRALMLLRARTLASGRTGVRPVVLETLLALLNSGITPIVHEYGSLGCSGDLAPLSHCAVVLVGEGRARDRDGTEQPVRELLAEADMEPLELAEKEGLALINGTDGMLGMLLMAIADLDQLVRTADVTTALTVQGLRGRDSVFR